MQEYNENMGSVDVNNALNYNHTTLRKSRQWTSKAIKILFDCIVSAAYLIFKNTLTIDDGDANALKNKYHKRMNKAVFMKTCCDEMIRVLKKKIADDFRRKQRPGILVL